MSASEDESNISPEENMNNAETPPSPTLSNSPPPTMVSNQTHDLSPSDYHRMLMQWHDTSGANGYEQGLNHLRRTHTTKSDVSSPFTQQQTTVLDKPHDHVVSSPASRDVWRVRDGVDEDYSHNKNTLVPYAREGLSGISFGANSAAVAAAAAFTAASFTEEERARNAAATAAFWAGFRQAAVAAAAATSRSDKSFSDNNISKYGI